MKSLLIATMIFSTVACAGEFERRVDEAASAKATVQGSQYDQTMGPAIGAAIGSCVPPGSNTPSNVGDFTLIGYVSRAGKIFSVDVQPKTAVAMCFAAQFTQMRLTPPPPSLLSRWGFPIAVKLSVRF
jgi:hypothetical protein